MQMPETGPAKPFKTPLKRLLMALKATTLLPYKRLPGTKNNACIRFPPLQHLRCVHLFEG
ncbi:hypothetical protein HNQ64_002892 [Prosthecobacter dejongeii]|uniref:Uncharacterized protein n=1 Tax=Prosthecobacter dejongeii TaxID=48465 RepID=A0A7W8DQB6_9BACT|nr:hypothetical protein [Prosthecobacter dejongeii]